MNKKSTKRRNTGKTNRRRYSRKKRKDSGYLLPIVCVVVMTLLSAILITFCISVALMSEGEEPVNSSTGRLENTMQSATDIGQTSATTQDNNTTTVPATTDKPITTEPAVTTKPPVTTAPNVTDTPVIPDPPVVPTLGFKADLSAYEQYMEPSGERWDNAYLMLVNASNRIEPDQEKSYPVLGSIKSFANCEDYDYVYYPGLTMNENAMMALTAMFLEAEANGLEGLDVTSAYRSYSRQSSIFKSNCDKTYHWLCEEEGCTQDWIGKDSKCPMCGKRSSNNTLPITQEEKEANVATYSCAPGTSDHQTGLAVDIVDTTLPSRFNNLIQEYGETESGKWLAENCWKFGFILRFPEGKEGVTGIIYEPWHFRFVGRTHAKQMKDLNMTLEEYTVHLESIGYFD